MVHTATFLGKDILGGAVNMNEIKINNPKEKNKKKGGRKKKNSFKVPPFRRRTAAKALTAACSFGLQHS